MRPLAEIRCRQKLSILTQPTASKGRDDAAWPQCRYSRISSASLVHCKRARPPIAIAGGGKSAAIGAGSEAGAGAVAEILTKGTIKVPVESILTFRLDQPLRVTAAR